MHASQKESALGRFLLSKHDVWFECFIIEKPHQDIVFDVCDVLGKLRVEQGN